MVKKIDNMLTANQLKQGEKFILTSLLERNKMTFLEKNKEKITAGFIWEEKGNEIIRICKYSSSAGDFKINIGEYRNLEKGDKEYAQLYNLLK
ncbi:hypothetical protein KAR52_01525 [Candidatus Pacearchaeota archaeon]|nr:hypothetical protein [Candidatus Pacearchaeota archaeon]